MSEIAIEVRDVWKIFGNRAPEALQAVQNRALSKAELLSEYNCVLGVAAANMQIKAGEIFCIMGLSGSGKSTLVRHINRLLEPTAGSILINGRDVMAMNDAELRRFRNKHIAMVFQNFGLMPHRSVLDNIALPLEIRGMNKTARLNSAERCLELVELNGWGNKFAHELSGGMQQRVGLARAHAVMQPISNFESQHGSISAEAIEYPKNTLLCVLITQAIDCATPSVIVDDTGNRIGAITQSDLLRTVIEGTETS